MSEFLLQIDFNVFKFQVINKEVKLDEQDEVRRYDFILLQRVLGFTNTVKFLQKEDKNFKRKYKNVLALAEPLNINVDQLFKDRVSAIANISMSFDEQQFFNSLEP